MDKSTTGKLSEILADIDSTNKMDQYMEHPKVVDSFRSFSRYFQSLPSVRQMDNGELIQ